MSHPLPLRTFSSVFAGLLDIVRILKLAYYSAVMSLAAELCDDGMFSWLP